MMTGTYNTIKAVNYARKWALLRNPEYYNFEAADLGGDCTNFVSQCLYAGCGVMNLTKIFGWYYFGLNNRSPAWTGVEELYKFLVENSGPGPFGQEMPLEKSCPGDIIQLSFGGCKFSHSLFVLNGASDNQGDILVASHTRDSLDKPLSDYQYAAARLIHIQGIKLK